MTRLLKASWGKETGFWVGCRMTWANTSSVAPAGIRLRPSGRAMFRGSTAMLTIHRIGKSTVAVMRRQRSWSIAWRRNVIALRPRRWVPTAARGASTAPAWLVIVRPLLQDLAVNGPDVMHRTAPLPWPAGW